MVVVAVVGVVEVVVVVAVVVVDDDYNDDEEEDVGVVVLIDQLHYPALTADGWDVVGVANSKIKSQGGPGVSSERCVCLCIRMRAITNATTEPTCTGT